MGRRGGSRKLLEVSETRTAELVDGILDRRRRADDPLLSRASDDIPSLLRYVADTTTRHVPAAVLREDVLDALELLEYARARIPAMPGVWDGLEYRLLSMRRRVQLSLQDVADRLQITRYAVDARERRGAAADKGLLRTPVADRAERTSRGAIDRWQRDKALSARTVMRVLEERLDELADDEDLVDMVEILTAPDDDRRPPAVTDPVSESDMRLLDRVVRMIRSRPVFEQLPEDSRIRAAVRQGEQLAEQHREITAELEKWRKEP